MRYSLLWTSALALSTAYLLSRNYLNRAMSTKTREGWRKALESLPSTPDNIPAFYFAHGSPMLVSDENYPHPIGKSFGRKGNLALFLEDFGPTLLKKYNPKGIIVFSAHWDVSGEVLVSNYGNENPLLYDYFGFPAHMYKLQFNSHGDSALSEKLVSMYKKAGLRARTIGTNDTRGADGRGFNGAGFDHGVFVPFKIMFGDDGPKDVPIVQVSIDGSLTPESNWKLGETITELRQQGYLILSGGLIIHNIREYFSFTEFDQSVHEAVDVQDPEKRKRGIKALFQRKDFKSAVGGHADHFMPLYIAAGAGQEGSVKTLCSDYGAATFAFGL